MEIVRLCPFSVATVVWGERHDDRRLTIVVKGTFNLSHRGEATLAPRQDTAHGDVSWDHNPQAALFAPSDFVPRKERIDVVFSGRAFAPGGDPTEIVVPRLRVGHLEKKVRVVGPRVWVQGGAGLRPSSPERFLAAPMRYELAAMQGENMSGIQPTSICTGSPLPRIETLEETPQFTPGFGPLPVHWRADSRGANEEALAFARRLRLEQAIVPPKFDFGIFNSAPIEQQIDELEAAPVIQLDHLCRRMPHIETRLPKIRPRAFFANRITDKPYEVDLKLDTVWIDGLRLVVVISWRGTTTMRDADSYALGRIVVAAESPEMEVSLEDVESPPVPQEDSSPRPILPRPFEGEIAEDEGYTLLPSRPVRPPVAFAEGPADAAAPGRPPSGLPPQPRDSSIPMPPSGERLIEPGLSTMLVGGSVPGPSEIVERALLGHFGEEPPSPSLVSALGPRTIEDVPVWENEEIWQPGSAKLPKVAASTASEVASDVERMQPSFSAQEDVVDDFDAGERKTLLAVDDTPAPATARTGSVHPPGYEASAQIEEAPATPRNIAPESAPLTQVPSTRKTGSVAPPATAASPGTPALTQAAFEESPMTERAPGQRGFGQNQDAIPPRQTDPRQTDGGATELLLEASSSFKVSSGSASISSDPSRVLSVDVPRVVPSGGTRKPAPSFASMPRLSLAELPIELCATLAARLDRHPEERSRIFDDMGLSEASYVASEQAWFSACRAEMEQGRNDLRATYERAYVAQLETERGELDISDYAHLMVNVELGDGDEVLLELGLPRAALVRIERVWQERMVADVAFCTRVRQAMASTRRAFWRARKGLPAGPDSSSTSTDGRGAAIADGLTSSRPRSSDR